MPGFWGQEITCFMELYRYYLVKRKASPSQSPYSGFMILVPVLYSTNCIKRGIVNSGCNQNQIPNQPYPKLQASSKPKSKPSLLPKHPGPNPNFPFSQVFPSPFPGLGPRPRARGKTGRITINPDWLTNPTQLRRDSYGDWARGLYDSGNSWEENEYVRSMHSVLHT